MTNEVPNSNVQIKHGMTPPYFRGAAADRDGLSFGIWHL